MAQGITDNSAEVPLDMADGGGLASHSPLTHPKSHSLGHHLVPPLSTWDNKLISYLLLFPLGGTRYGDTISV